LQQRKGGRKREIIASLNSDSRQEKKKNGKRVVARRLISASLGKETGKRKKGEIPLSMGGKKGRWRGACTYFWKEKRGKEVTMLSSARQERKTKAQPHTTEEEEL